MKEILGNVQSLPASKWKKLVKWILIGLWLIIGFLWLYSLITYFYWDSKYETYNRKNPKCYEKCKKAYKGDKSIARKYAEHLNSCERVCIKPKWDACTENCKVTMLWEELQWKYNYENYKNWFEAKYSEWFIPMMDDKWGTIKTNILKKERQYRQWISEVFSWYKDEIREYELCEDSCGPIPEYIFIN